MALTLAHCIHHEMHIEVCYNFADRIAYIKEYKSVQEQPLRLANFWEFPTEQLPASLQLFMQQVADAYEQEGLAREQVEAVNDQPFSVRTLAYSNWLNADTIWQRAEGDLANGMDLAMPDLMVLHDQLVAGGRVCTWNGHSIFEDADFHS